MQIQTNEKENSSILRFKNVQFNKPDPKQFDPPSDYSQYNTQEELMQAGLPKATPPNEVRRRNLTTPP
jgi:hypothetical protein